MHLRKALENLAAELDRMADQAERIDEGIGGILAGTTSGSRCDSDIEQARMLQSVDFLRQMLACLATYVGDLAGLVPDEALIDVSDAAARLPLRDLARSLADSAGVTSPENPAEGQSTGGDVTLF